MAQRLLGHSLESSSFVEIDRCDESRAVKHREQVDSDQDWLGSEAPSEVCHSRREISDCDW